MEVSQHRNSLMEQLSDLLDRVEEPEDVESLHAFAQVLVENSDLIIDTIESIRTYCSTDGKVTQSAISNVDIKDFT